MAFDSSQPFYEGILSETQGFSIYRSVLKRGLDLLLVLVVALPVGLLLAVLALLIAVDGGSPLYSQLRVGRNGRTFRMWKLRSMVPNAREALKVHLAADPDARREWQQYQKLRNDPRITRIGRILRMTSLDELPQLWNVLRGDMAIIGPRPMMIEQRALYPGTAYYAMRPGLSGYWQISERNESSFAQRATYDTRYFHDLSFLTDLVIILRTFRVVLRGTGC